MTERSRIYIPKISSSAGQRSIEDVFFRSAKLIGAYPVSDTQKWALVASICVDIFPEKINALSQSLKLQIEGLDNYFERAQTDPALIAIRERVLTQLEIERLQKNLSVRVLSPEPIKVKHGHQTGKHVLAMLETYKAKNPGQEVNLAEIARKLGQTRASISLHYKKLSESHDLPPIRKLKKQDS